MRKNWHFWGLSALFGLLFLGCGGAGVEYLSKEDSRQYSTTGIDYHDILEAAQKSVQSLLASSFTKKIPEKEPRILAISDVINDTMQMIDTEQLTRKVTREMRNSGKYILTIATHGSGASGDAMIKSARKLRDDEEFNQYTTLEKGELVSPQLSLSGKIVQKNSRVSGFRERVDYYFLLTLTDLKKGFVVWDDEVEISKIGDGKRSSW